MFKLNKKSLVFKKCYVLYVKGFIFFINRIQLIVIGNDQNLVEFFLGFDDDGFFLLVFQLLDIDDWLVQYCEEGQIYRQFYRESLWFLLRKWVYIKQKFNLKGNIIFEKYLEGKIYLFFFGKFDSDYCVDFNYL